MTQKQKKDLFSNFDVNSWQQTAISIDDFINKTIIVYATKPVMTDFGGGFQISFIDPFTEEAHSIDTVSKNLMAFAQQFSASDVTALPIIIGRVRQAYIVRPDTNFDFDRMMELLADL